MLEHYLPSCSFRNLHKIASEIKNHWEYLLTVKNSWGSYAFFFSFFLNFCRTRVLFVGSLIPLFWTSGDVYSGFQSQGGFLTCSLSCLHAILQIHLWCDTCWLYRGQHVSCSRCLHAMHVAEVGCQDSIRRPPSQRVDTLSTRPPWPASYAFLISSSGGSQRWNDFSLKWNEIGYCGVPNPV